MWNSSSIYIKLLFVLSAVFLFSIPPALGEVVFTANQAAFNATSPGLAVQDFASGSAGPGSVVSCSEVINENTADACFSPGDILPGIQFFAADVVAIVGPGFNNNPFTILIPVSSADSLDITFPDNTVNAVGMDLGCILEGPGTCSDNVLVRVFGQGDALIGSTTVAVTDFFDTFLGIQSDVPITRINLSNGNQVLFFEGIDRISFGLSDFTANIPTLSEWGMIAAAAGFALVGMFYAMRKRRASA